MKDFDSIDPSTLDSISGGRAGRALASAAKWAWQNVGAPVAGGALYEWASDRLGGGRSTNTNTNAQQQQQPQPQSGQ
jgi:hypothetical protein